ncbi:OLC1v1025062C2 [Oldenlandia corymbosa var. corymbosa]|uniref:OLC1v1025062C2 n=1 Tax=Oldenlandia corymbosa var. corymbosa TaxID=529605 RepID=A0AAV1C664_OLDCO|nr:OLC1v1025062C2 [Oldenlandia corymbosa var. corymbosa]
MVSWLREVFCNLLINKYFFRDLFLSHTDTHSYSVSRHYHRGESFKVAVRRRCQFTPSSEGRNVEAMADNSKEEFIQLVKRFGAFLTLKISNIFQRLDSRSAGALAGLAFALVFTWRILRSPPGSQRRLPKRQATAPSTSGVSHANADPSASIIPTSSEDSRAQNAIDEFFQTAKPTLGQIVRQRLSEGRKVTCRLLGVVLEETSPEELQNQATVRSSVLEVLLEITKFCDLYLMERVLDDESEKRVLLALEEAGVFTSGGLVKDKVLFCSTETGRTSFVRQLEPDWHIDTNPEIVTQLARFIKYQLQISPTKPERSASNVFSSTSLEQFFGCV